jgi:hypothetical protein
MEPTDLTIEILKGILGPLRMVQLGAAGDGSDGAELRRATSGMRWLSMAQRVLGSMWNDVDVS